jgi:hypothetical protein
MLMPRGIEIPRFKKYNGKGDPIGLVNAFIALSSEFFLHERILAKNFSRTLREATLEWFSSLPNNSIHSFQELVEVFINHFQVHMNPKLRLDDFMICKQHEHEKITDFIS